MLQVVSDTTHYKNIFKFKISCKKNLTTITQSIFYTLEKRVILFYIPISWENVGQPRITKRNNFLEEEDIPKTTFPP